MRKKYFNNSKKLNTKNCNLEDLDFKTFPEIEDFQMILKDGGKGEGFNLYFYSENLGFLASFPCWSYVDKDLEKMKFRDIPCGVLNNVFTDADQGWEIIIFVKRDYVYVMQARNECSGIFEKWFRVNKNLYFSEWEKLLTLAKENRLKILFPKHKY